MSDDFGLDDVAGKDAIVDDDNEDEKDENSEIDDEVASVLESDSFSEGLEHSWSNDSCDDEQCGTHDENKQESVDFFIFSEVGGDD